MQFAWRGAQRLVGHRRTGDSWGADSTAIGKQLGELNTLQVKQLALPLLVLSEACRGLPAILC